MEENLANKIRGVIKEKLMELDAFVDDELPEYIMVLVANKKSKEAMYNDLNLFLAKNTNKFVTWLHDMLEKVEVEATVQCDTNNSSDNVLASECNMLKNNSDEDEDLNNMLTLTDPESNEDFSSNIKPNDVATGYLNVASKSSATAIDKAAVYKNEIPKPTVSTIKLPMYKSKVTCKSTVTSLKRAAESIDDEYDPLNPSVRSVASVVAIEERKASLPKSLQANKMLLFKAIDDANKSILGKENIDEVYKPTPIKVLNSPLRKYARSVSQPSLEILAASNLLQPPRKRFASTSVQVETIKESEPLLLLNAIEEEEDIYIPDHISHDIQFSNSNVDDELDFPLEDERMDETEQTLEDYMSDDEMMEDGSFVKASENVEFNGVNETSTHKSIQPQFVVTLDGVGVCSFIRKHDDDNDNDDAEHETEDSFFRNVQSPEDPDCPAIKSSDKCKFWPICKNGDSCPYVHPKTVCKLFPNCEFGGKCHFIHPICKFDSLCSRKDCPYTHKSKRDYAVIQASATNVVPLMKYQPVSVPYQPTICKFHPKCSVYNCPFLHPKKCKFGTLCKSASCPFTHPAFPSRHQMKWKAASTF